jgi:hypothetical protein
MVSPRGTDSSRGWNEGISAPATLMRLAAGAGREAQERTFIVYELHQKTCPQRAGAIRSVGVRNTPHKRLETTE